MKNIIGYYSEQRGEECWIHNSNRQHTVSSDPEKLLAFIAAQDNDAFHLVHNLTEFFRPIKKLLPAKITKTLYDKERVLWGTFKLFMPEISGGMLGINHKERINTHGNFYTETVNDITIYDIANYFPGMKLESADQVKEKGLELLMTLRKMGFEPNKLTTPAAIYEQCVLSKLNYPTIYTLPETAYDMMEWAANYIREWRSVYQVGIFPYGEAKDYDMTAAYPSEIAKLPNMREAEFFYSEDGCIPPDAEWGLIRANIDVLVEVSGLTGDDETCRKGPKVDFISNEEADYYTSTGKAIVEPLEAWYFTVPKRQYLFDYSMRKLYQQRTGGLQSRLAKDFSVSVWGKMQQYTGEMPAKYYNSIYASMVVSRVKLKLMEFIDDNELQDDLVSVTVDGCIATKKLPVTQSSQFGEWRVNLDSQAIILDTNFQWIGEKRQLGITAADLIAEIKAHPAKQAWKNVFLSLLEPDRKFKEFPENGYDLLKKVYQSEALEARGELMEV